MILYPPDHALNPDGKTYHLGRLMEALTGGKISSAETMWTAERLRQLMRDQGKPKAEAVAIMREEAKAKPWEGKAELSS